MEQMLTRFAGRVNNLSFWHNSDSQVYVNETVEFIIKTSDCIYTSGESFSFKIACPQKAVF